MNTAIPEPRLIPVSAIRPFVHRAREQTAFEKMKASMADVGLKVPIQVRDLGRTDKDGIRYELICGEGRTEAAKQLGWEKISAIVQDVPNTEIAGRFLAENMIRRPLPWAVKGRMIRDAMRQEGLSFAQVAARYHMAEVTARQYIAALDKTAQEVADDVAAMSINDATVFTTVPKEGQKVVMEVIRETGQSVKAIAKIAREHKPAAGEGWTKAALEKALRAKDEDLAKSRQTLKRLRLHHAIGPVNIQQLLKTKGFRTAAEAARVNLTKFEALAK